MSKRKMEKRKQKELRHHKPAGTSDVRPSKAQKAQPRPAGADTPHWNGLSPAWQRLYAAVSKAASGRENLKPSNTIPQR